jgi:hypothetical protein
MDTGLDENQAEFSILVFAVTTLEMLADGDGLPISSDSCHVKIVNEEIRNVPS